jgi:hypothetical protein
MQLWGGMYQYVPLCCFKGLMVEGLLIPTVDVFVVFNDDDGVNPVSTADVRWSLEHSEQSKLQEINDHALEEW